MIKKIYKVSELGEPLGFNKKELAEIDREIENHSLSRSLAVLRVKNGLTQSEFAKKAGVSQATISKLEHSSDDRITIKDVNMYSQILGYKLQISLGRPKSAAKKFNARHRTKYKAIRCSPPRLFIEG